MEKDIIYIDTDDDITSIVGKLKKAKRPLLALVPPKRTGALQSSVNLKLVKKAADGANKKLILVTNDPALRALAAGVKIPVAKNLQSKPELLAPPPLDDASDDVINGQEIAVAELAETAPRRRKMPSNNDLSQAVAAIDSEDDNDDEPKPVAAKKSQKAKKIPNFSSFRKKLLIFSSLGVLLIAFLVWAIWFAPRADITVIANTSDVDISETLTLDPSLATNLDAELVQPIVKQSKKTSTVDFDATGTKEIGEAARGSVVIYNAEAIQSVTLAAGTIIASGNLQYKLDASVTVPSVTGSLSSPMAGVSGPVSVTAVNIGADYNIGSDNTLAISGYDASDFYAKPQAACTGGSKETVKIVQQSDIDAAADKLKTDNSNQIEQELISQMGSDVTPLRDSFSAVAGNVTSKPAVGEKADRATASLEVTYTIIGLSNRDLNELLDRAALDESDGSSADQRIYDNGLKKLTLKDFQSIGDNKYSVRLSAVAKIGPKLDESQIKQRAVGQRSGEIRERLTAISGVSDVEIKFSPFWVNTAPGEDKITVEFRVSE
jgi:hypothetical protein